MSGHFTPLQAGFGDQLITVSAQAECIDNQSLEVANIENARARFTCLQNKGVQQTCGLDGRTARLNAFRQWMAKLDRAQHQCDQTKGTFSFKSADFVEPRDETFCSEATVDVSYGAFENPVCHFTSKCPSVQVICSRGSSDAPLFKIPPQAIQLPGVPIPISVR